MGSHSAAIERCVRIPDAAELDGIAHASSPSGACAVGVLLLQLDFTLLYANQAAERILSYPAPEHDPATFPAAVQERIRRLFDADTLETSDPRLSLLKLTSGRREYVCRPLRLDGVARPPILALLMERPVRASELSEVGRRFHLSPRERETIGYIALGLTTKEMAQRMRVSPNTIKQFVRFTMTKMGVTTRTGIVGKLLAG